MQRIQKLSLVVPVFNEEANIPPLVEQICEAMARLAPLPWELWLIDDGSTDASLGCIKALCAQHCNLHYVSFQENAGQSAAFAAGFAAATGDAVLTLDADLQNDPADIPAMLAHYEQGFDMVAGWRVNRQDSPTKRWVSRLANAVRNALTQERIHDTGCSLKIMRASMAKQIPMFKGMHRFLPTLMRMQGAKISELAVNHRSRHSGVSKYGVFSRGWSAFQDLVAVNWMLRRHKAGVVRESS